MPTHTALASLLPLAGAVALTIFNRIATGRASTDEPRAAPPRAKEMPDPAKRPSRSKQSMPDDTCTGCGTSIPARETLCALCARKADGAVSAGRTTALRLVLLGTMTAIIGSGWLLSQ